MPQLQTLLLVYSVFQLLPGLVLGVCKCPGIYSFLPDLLVYVHRAVCSNLWWYFIFLWNQWWYPLYHFLLHLFDSSLFFFISLGSGLSILLIFSKNQLLDLLIFLKGFFYVSISFSSALILVISCLLLAFGLVCSFLSSSFNCDVRVLFWDPLSFLMWAFSTTNFPLNPALAVSQRFWYVVC